MGGGSHYSEIHGARLRYEIAGDGPPVVFLHAGIADSRMWDDQFGAFSERHRVLRYDMRGFGQSSFPADSFSLADDLLDLLDYVGIDAAALVGASMGANVALELAVIAPGRVRALVLAPPGNLRGERSEELRRVDEAEEAAVARGDLDEAVRLNLDLWVAGPRRSIEEVDGEVVRRVGEMQRRAFAVQVPAFEQDPPPTHQRRLEGRLAGYLREIQAPTLVIVGVEDVRDILDAADELEGAVPGARKVALPASAHLPNMERPAEFNELVIGFLADALERV
ncbi:MAG: alpha/beta hydrolase [Actinomycetota bacterium]|nr:alpha/beta hydrolase [Actinomycetota bacterium]